MEIKVVGKEEVYIGQEQGLSLRRNPTGLLPLATSDPRANNGDCSLNRIIEGLFLTLGYPFAVTTHAPFKCNTNLFACLRLRVKLRPRPGGSAFPVYPR